MPSAGRGAIRLASAGQCMAATNLSYGVQVGLLVPKAAGDPSSWTPVVSATVWPRTFEQPTTVQQQVPKPQQCASAQQRLIN